MTSKLMRSTTMARQLRASHGFGSTAMRSCMGNIPVTPDKTLYQGPCEALYESFDAQVWYSDPVQTIINGKPVEGGSKVASVDAFFKENGSMVHTDAAGLEALKAHLSSVDTTTKDYREVIRKIEDELCSPEYAPTLMVNQAFDFFKQDSFTEIEEWVQCSKVEQRLNDLLLADETAGKLKINRDAAFVGCVSNFSNFLDLSKKVLRNLEVGIPIVVLSRSNTTQHMYRWFQILSERFEAYGLPQSLITYASIDVPGQRALLLSQPNSPMYFTGSREVAAALKEVAPNLMAATAGPNTMVVEELNDATRMAACVSSTIENAGQCTHMRHLVAPNADLAAVEKLYDNTRIIDTPLEAIKAGFRPDGMFAQAPTTAGTAEGYTKHPTLPTAYKVSPSLPLDDINEKWREGFIDVTSPGGVDKVKDPKFLDELSAWIVRNGPITLAVNGDDAIMRQLFEQTGLTVYTVGTLEKPALTVSARPQEYEAFGEFPARPTLQKYTKFPVLVPSAAPTYHSQWETSYLLEKAAGGLPASLKGLDVESVSAETKGYIAVLHEFLADSVGARDNTQLDAHVRTCVSGWQRPPLNGAFSVVRADATTSVDALAVYLAPYLATNAASQLYISVDPANAACVSLVEGLGHEAKIESEAAYKATEWAVEPWNVQTPIYNGKQADGGAPMPGPFLAILLPVGHIKCLIPDDQEFAAKWKASDKWLAMSA